MLDAEVNVGDPRMQINVVCQGADGGLLLDSGGEQETFLDDEE